MFQDLLFLGPLLFLCLFSVDSVRSETVHVESAKSCALMHCDHGDNCISRKFWCKKPPCPSMMYCSKTPRESLQGPITCASVRCSKGYICLVRVRRCRWEQKCEQQIARCVSEREHYDGAASCADFQCPSGRQCILKESLCANPPCKLIKSCAKSTDVQIWHSRCRILGCPSEYECFLRRSSDNCPSNDSCKHTPDCTIANVGEVQVNPNCLGWVCPRNQECSAMVTESCSSGDTGVENCKVNRTCHESLANSNSTPSPSPKPISRMTIINIRDDTLSTKNMNDSPSHFTEQTTAAVVISVPTTSETDCNQNQSTIHRSWGEHLQKWNPRKGSFYRTPVYVRSAVKKNISKAREYRSEERPTDNSTTEWLDYLRLKTGVDAIDVWVKQAEENSDYEQFNEWLTAVKSTLGSFRFEIWLREIRKLTSEYPAFQKWLVNNDATSALTTPHTDDRNDTKLKTLTVFPDQEPTLRMDSEQVHKTTENPAQGNVTLGDFYPNKKTGNESLVSSMDQGTLGTPLRKNAGHPRINYGRARGYNEHQDFGLPKLKNGMVTWYFTNYPSGGLQPPQYELDKTDTEKKIEKNPSQDDLITHSQQLDHRTEGNDSNLGHSRIELSNQRDNSFVNNSTHDSPVDSVVKLQKTVSNDSILQDIVRVRNLQNPLSNVVAKKNDEHEMHDSIKGNVNAHVPREFENLRPEIKDQVSNRSGLDPNLLFDKVEDPEWNSTTQRPPVPTAPRQFTEEDRKASWQVSESPESMRRQYYQRIYELDHKVPETPTKLRHPSTDIGTEQARILKKTYALFAPAADEVHITSPWDVIRVLDPQKRTSYTLLKFPEEHGQNQMRIIGYPLVVSSDQAKIPPQNAKDLSDIPRNSGSGRNSEKTNPWNQIFQQRHISRELGPPISQYSDYDTFGKQNQKIESRIQEPRPSSVNEEQNNKQPSFDVQKPDLPVSAPLENWYPWNGEAPHSPSKVNHFSRLPINPHDTGMTDLKKSSKGYRGAIMNSQEYIDAYVNAIIEDALSKIIQNWTNSENPSPLSHDFRATTSERLDKKRLGDNIQEAHSTENPALEKTDKKGSRDAKISHDLGSVQLIEDHSTSLNQMKITPIPNLSTDSTTTDIDYQYDCEDEKRDSPKTMETKQMSSVIEDTYSPASTNDQGEEYYPTVIEQQEYFEGFSRYEDEYSEDLDTNLTDYDFQYYDDEKYSKILPEETDVAAELPQVQS